MQDRPRYRTAAAAIGATMFLMLAAVPAHAVEGLDFTTPYPAVGVDPGGEVTFPLVVQTTEAERVELEVVTKPEAFETTLRGGGFIVDAVFTNTELPPELELQVTVPQDTAAGAYDILLRATGSAGTTDLPLALTVGEAAGGTVTITTDFPSLRGDNEASLVFDLQLENDTAQEITFGLEAQGEPGWDVQAELASEAQAATAVVAAGDSAGIRVTANAPADAPVGTYPIIVRAAGGGYTAESQLQVELTGSYAVTLSTPDGRLDTRVTGGSTSTFDILVENTGSADLTDVSVVASAPTGWTVTFAPETMPLLAAGGAPATFSATITPAGSAVAGDYSIEFDVNAAEDATDAIAVRTTVETSSLWGFVGLGLIAVVIIGLFLVFRQYGRR